MRIFFPLSSAYPERSGQVRLRWLKFMYLYTFIGAGVFGLSMLLVPHVVQTLLGFPSEDPIVFGIVGSVYTAFGLLSLPGFRHPLEFVPILVLQLCYKSIWLIFIVLPLLFSGRLPSPAATLLIIFTTYIIGDLIAIPFSLIVSKKAGS